MISDYSFYHFFTYAAIHCEWNDWIPGTCSTTCGTGTRTDTRTKRVNEKNGGACSGQHTRVEECKIAECPGM